MCATSLTDRGVCFAKISFHSAFLAEVALSLCFFYCHKEIIPVVISFDPTSYTVTEGDDGFVELTLVRSGDLSRATVVTVTTADGSAIGIVKNKHIAGVLIMFNLLFVQLILTTQLLQ